MQGEAHAWLDARGEGVPEALRVSIRRAIDGVAVPDGDLEAVLRAAAHDELLRAVEGTAGGEDALALLTADALITYVCEAVSDRDPGALARLS